MKESCYSNSIMPKNIAYRGFDASITFDLSEVSELDDVDLVGKTALFSLKKDRKAGDDTAKLTNDFIVSSEHLDSDNPKILIVAFSAEQMQVVSEDTYFFDLKLFNEDGTGLLYIPYQEMQAIDDVTDRISIS